MKKQAKQRTRTETKSASPQPAEAAAVFGSSSTGADIKLALEVMRISNESRRRIAIRQMARCTYFGTAK